MCPAVGQGALAIETRAEGAGFDAVAALDHAATHAAVTGRARRPRVRSAAAARCPSARTPRSTAARCTCSRVVAAPDGTRGDRATKLEGPAADAEAHRHARLGAVLLERGAREILDAVYSDEFGDPSGPCSKVYLVGAGPGDPELITVKGRRILEQADAVLYDHLANEALLDLAPPHAERLYVGKKKSDHAFTQEEICALLIDRARRGLTVVRLKGGDPFIFGRGGEEAEALADAGIPFEIVPGVTTPLGIAAYTGVPLTHREHTSAVTFVTGHDVEAIDWGKVGHAETLVIFMGLTTFPDIAARADRPRPRPPIRPRWRCAGPRGPTSRPSSARSRPAARMLERGMKPPATIVVGEVVRLREQARLVRAPAAVRQAHRGHARPGAGRRARRAPRTRSAPM